MLGKIQNAVPDFPTPYKHQKDSVGTSPTDAFWAGKLHVKFMTACPQGRLEAGAPLVWGDREGKFSRFSSSLQPPISVAVRSHMFPDARNEYSLGDGKGSLGEGNTVNILPECSAVSRLWRGKCLLMRIYEHVTICTG